MCRSFKFPPLSRMRLCTLTKRPRKADVMNSTLQKSSTIFSRFAASTTDIISSSSSLTHRSSRISASFKVTKGDKFGIYNSKTGNLVVNVDCDRIESITDKPGRYEVTRGPFFGIYNTIKGKLVAEIEYLKKVTVNTTLWNMFDSINTFGVFYTGAYSFYY